MHAFPAATRAVLLPQKRLKGALKERDEARRSIASLEASLEQSAAPLERLSVLELQLVPSRPQPPAPALAVITHHRGVAW